MEAANRKKPDEIIAKLERIFETFARADFTTNNYVYFEKLIKHLAEEENDFILKAPFAVTWVDRCINLINEKDINQLNPRVLSFMLNFCALLISNQWVLMEIKERKFLDKVLDVVKRDHEKLTPSMKLSLIRILTSISNYTIGLIYLRTTRSWRFLIEYCNQDHTIYVVREARKLLFELLYKYAVKANDEHTVVEIMNEIVQPIMENVFDETTDKITIVVEDTELQHKLASTLDLLSYIFQQTLECEEKTKFSILCREKYNLEFNLWKLHEMSMNQPFMQKILTTITSYNFCRLVDENWSGQGQIAPENFSRFGIAFFNLMKFCVTRRDCINFLNLAEIFHILWKKLGARAPKEILVENESVRFENQLIVLHLMPMLFILKSKELKHVEIFDNYIMKLFEVSCEHTLRICYSFRDLVLNQETEYMVPVLAYKSIHGILAMENILERDQAVLVFQAMTYALQEFNLNAFRRNHENDELHQKHQQHHRKSVDNNADASYTSNSTSSTDLIAEIPNVLYAALVGMQRFIKRYRITWTESLETICVVNFVIYLLGNPNMTSRLTVQALKLLQLSIEHYLSPNMALLVDTLHGSGLQGIAPIVAKRFHDPAWEVRDSTLELTTSIANISRRKFPPFQQYLVENKIAPIVYEMAKNDCEPYVRASALKCLAKMIAINVIWENELSKLDLSEHLFWLLFNESEGIVRKEAVSTLSTIYEHRKLPNNTSDILFSILSHCVVVDLHWEVKVAALQFWEYEIGKQFTNQGMIDGTFPTVTFSKEHKKIVTLTEKEINLRIVKILNSLSQLGCLGVILRCLDEDCDLEVVKTAVCVVKRLMEKLNKYNYESLLMEQQQQNETSKPSTSASIQKSSTNSNDHQMPVTIKMECEDETSSSAGVDGFDGLITDDAIIERILDDQDMNYLISACESQLKLNTKTEKLNVDSNFYKEFANVTAKEFVETVKRLDMEQLLHRHEWFLCAESLNSLLDDILIEIEPNDDRIFADCY